MIVHFVRPLRFVRTKNKQLFKHRFFFCFCIASSVSVIEWMEHACRICIVDKCTISIRTYSLQYEVRFVSMELLNLIKVTLWLTWLFWSEQWADEELSMDDFDEKRRCDKWEGLDNYTQSLRFMLWSWSILFLDVKDNYWFRVSEARAWWSQI